MRDEEFESIVAELVASGSRVRERVSAVPPERWDDVVHTGDGPWTRRQLLAHMAANDLRQITRIRIGAGIGSADDEAEHERQLDVHRWNADRVNERRGASVAELLDEFEQHRAGLVKLLRGLTPQQRERPMPFRGTPTPLAEMVTGLIGHLEAHSDELLRL